MLLLYALLQTPGIGTLYRYPIYTGTLYIPVPYTGTLCRYPIRYRYPIAYTGTLCRYPIQLYLPYTGTLYRYPISVPYTGTLYRYPIPVPYRYPILVHYTVLTTLNLFATKKRKWTLIYQ